MLLEPPTFAQIFREMMPTFKNSRTLGATPDLGVGDEDVDVAAVRKSSSEAAADRHLVGAIL